MSRNIKYVLDKLDLFSLHFRIIRNRIVFRSRGAKLGKRVLIYGPVYVSGSLSNLKIGDGSRIGHWVTLNLSDKITIGRNTHVSGGVMIHTSSLYVSEVPRMRHYTQQVVIGDNVWVASNAIILPGTKIGDNSVVAAGSVVTRDVPPNTLVGGVPAKIIKNLSF